MKPVNFFLLVVFLMSNITCNVRAQSLSDLLNKPIDLSLNSAVLFALDKNSEIEISWERYVQSKNFVKESEADLYPEINFNFSAGREYLDPSAGTSQPKSDSTNNVTYGISVEQIIYDGFSTVQEIRRRRDLNEAAFWRAQSSVEEVLSETIENYLDMVRYDAEVRQVKKLIASIKETLAYVTSQFDEGATNKVMLDYAKSRLAFAVTDMNRAKSSYSDAKSRLEFLTGKLPPKVVTYYPEELNPEKLDLDFYLEALEEKNASIVASDYEIEAMKKQYKIQETADLPEAVFEMDAVQSHNDGGAVGSDRELSATLRVTYSIFDGFKNKYAKKRVFSQVKELEHRKEDLRKGLVRDIKLFYNQIVANKRSIITTDEEIRSSEALKALNEENFKSGNINIIELIESAERLSSAEIRKIELVNNQYINAYNLIIRTNIMDQNFFCDSC